MNLLCDCTCVHLDIVADMLHIILLTDSVQLGHRLSSTDASKAARKCPGQL